jgi:predicted DNA-binding transcriptional regulator YafY
MNANNRRKEIMTILERRRCETITNLAFEFGVSKRTIKYDIAALMDSHEPIETQSGRGGGVMISRDFKMYKGDISNEQQNCLISIAQSTYDINARRIIQELLRSHGSRSNKEQIERL